MSSFLAGIVKKELFHVEQNGYVLANIEMESVKPLRSLVVKCPYCGHEIDDKFLRREVARQMGRSKSPRKKKDPAEMSRLGKLSAAKRKAQKE